MLGEIYTGAIIEESLEDSSILGELKVVDIAITDDEKPEDRWHIYTVEADKVLIDRLAKFIKPQHFYAHFWNTNKGIIAVFRDKVFEFNYNDKEAWAPAVAYGLSVGIPEEQLDFLVE